MGGKRFIIRVYGLFINEKNEILLAEEERFGMHMTKFPGGGLIAGEGPIDCLRREIMEELGQPIEIIRHYYTTDYFQKSYFHENAQLIAIYYAARFSEPVSPDFAKQSREPITFRYRDIKTLDVDELTLPVDKTVMAMLKSEYL